MNVMTVDDYHATIEFDPDLDMFRGGKFWASTVVQIFTAKTRQSFVQSSSARSPHFLRCVLKKGLNPSAIFRANSIYGSRRNCTKNWQLRHRLKVKASTLWRKKLCRKALRKVVANSLTGQSIEMAQIFPTTSLRLFTMRHRNRIGVLCKSR